MVWFSKLATRIDKLGRGKKERIQVTRMLRVNTTRQTTLVPEENKMGINEAKQFLQSLPHPQEVMTGI